MLEVPSAVHLHLHGIPTVAAGILDTVHQVLIQTQKALTHLCFPLYLFYHLHLLAPF